jgi:hypothetical protein
MTYILDDNDRVTISRRPLTVTVSGRDATGAPLAEGRVLLEAWTCDAPAPAALHPRPSTLVLPRVDEPVVIRVVPGQGHRQFPAGVILDVTLRTERTRYTDEEVVVVRDVEVSGFFRELLGVEALDAARLSVTAIDKVTDPAIPPLAQAARAAARYRLGVERAARAHDILVAVDMSSSMSPRFDDGTVVALVDVVVGLSQVVGHGRSLGVVLLGDRSVPVRSAGPLELAQDTRRAIHGTGLGCGFRSVPREPRVDRETIVYVVTDAVPVDIAALRAARQRGENRCLVVAGRGRTSRAAADVPTTVLRPPPPQVDASTHLQNTPDVLNGVVDSMLAAAGAVPR